MGEQSSQTTGRSSASGATRPPVQIVGPAKWFAAGALVTGSVAALVVTLVLRQPRSLPPLMATTPVVAVTDPVPVSPAVQAQPLQPTPPAVAPPTIATTEPTAATEPTTSPADVPTRVPAQPVPVTPPEPAAPAPTPTPKVAPQPPVPKPVTPQPAPVVAPAVSGGTINVNTATSAELELLPQIGPALAARIIEYRTSHGRFTSLNDLDKVKGIGPKTLAKVKALIRFE